MRNFASQCKNGKSTTKNTNYARCGEISPLNAKTRQSKDHFWYIVRTTGVPIPVEVSCPKTCSSSGIGAISSSCDTLLLSLPLLTANKATSRPSSSSSLALSAPGCSPLCRCRTLFGATGCYWPGMGAGYGFLGAALAMGAPCLGGGRGQLVLQPVSLVWVLV